MKVLISLLSFLNGAYMLCDGIFVMLNGKYIGPAKPGLWANLFYKFNIDVFTLGPLFIVFGICWIIFLILLWTKQSRAYLPGVIISMLTLWYLPVGTIFSLIVLIILLTQKRKLQLQ